MSFAEAVRSVFRQYAGFEGRARRSEFWWFYLFATLATVLPYVVAVVVLLLSGNTFTDDTSQNGPAAVFGLLLLALVGLIGLALLLPQIAVSVRRLHDTGRSGWWYLIGFVPFGGIVLIVFWVMDSEPQANVHGSNPKNPVGAGEWGQLASG